MVNMNKEERIQQLSDTIKILLQQIDIFTIEIQKEDFELLEHTKKVLEDRISTNMSALPIIMACGGNYDSLEDEMKLKTLELLIILIKTRINYREELIKRQKQNLNKQEILKIFGI